MRAFFILSSVSISILMVGCAQRLDELDERVQDMQNRVGAIETKSGLPVGGDRDREMLEGQKMADVRSQVAAMRNDLTVMAGRVEAIEYENKNLQNRLDKMNEEMDRRMKDVDQVKESVSNSNADDLESEYNLAMKAHQDGDFEKAEKLFESMLIKYPKSSLSDNALFWLGEGNMARKQPKKAITRFQELIEKFPKSDKKCEAMDRQIAALQELNMKKEADAFKQAKAAECPNK